MNEKDTLINDKAAIEHTEKRQWFKLPETMLPKEARLRNFKIEFHLKSTMYTYSILNNFYTTYKA